MGYRGSCLKGYTVRSGQAGARLNARERKEVEQGHEVILGLTGARH